MTEESMPYRHSEPFMGEESILYNADVDSSLSLQNDGRKKCVILALVASIHNADWIFGTSPKMTFFFVILWILGSSPKIWQFENVPVARISN